MVRLLIIPQANSERERWKTGSSTVAMRYRQYEAGKYDVECEVMPDTDIWVPLGKYEIEFMEALLEGGSIHPDDKHNPL